MNARMIVTGLCCLFGLLATRAGAASALGDAGHFIVLTPDMYANNPTGAAFTVTLHRHVWPADWANNGDYRVWVWGPDGNGWPLFSADARSGQNCRRPASHGSRQSRWMKGVPDVSGVSGL